MGDNYKNVKIGWGHLKTIGPILTRLIIVRSRGFKFVQRKEIALLQGEMIAKE
jgi:hypothetical protein